MKLIFIIRLARRRQIDRRAGNCEHTDFKVFHNHLTIDAVSPVFEFGTEPFWKLVHLFRIETDCRSRPAEVDLIYTFCYAKDSDDAHVAKVAQNVEENGGEVCFVLLTAEKMRNRKTHFVRIAAKLHENEKPSKCCAKLGKNTNCFRLFPNGKV